MTLSHIDAEPEVPQKENGDDKQSSKQASDQQTKSSKVQQTPLAESQPKSSAPQPKSVSDDQSKAPETQATPPSETQPASKAESEKQEETKTIRKKDKQQKRGGFTRIRQ